MLVTSLLFLTISSRYCYSEVKNNKSGISSDLVLQWGFVHFPPLIYLDKDGKYKGELEALMAGVSLYSGILYTPMEFPNIRAIFNLNQQKVNFAIGVKSLVNEENNFFISSFPIAKMQLRILWRTDSAPVSTIADLAGKSLVLLKGYTYGGLRTQIESIAAGFMSVSNHNRAISALTHKRGDYALVYKTASEYSMTAVAQLDFDHVVIGEVDLYFILDRNVPHAEQIMKQLETGYLLYQQSLNPNTERVELNDNEPKLNQ